MLEINYENICEIKKESHKYLGKVIFNTYLEDNSCKNIYFCQIESLVFCFGVAKPHSTLIRKNEDLCHKFYGKINLRK